MSYPPAEMVGMHRRHPLDDVASAQYGLATRAQAYTAGLTRQRIDIELGHGTLQRVAESVFRLAGTPPSYEQTLLAGCLTAGRPAYASHRAAAAIWGIDLGRQPTIEVVTTRPSSSRTPGVIVHRPLRLPPHHTTVERGIPLTTVPRTLVDLGATVPEFLVARALEVSLTRRLVTMDDVVRMIAESGGRGRRGVGVLRRVVDGRDLGARPADSVLEAAMARLCRDAGLPEPEYQYEVVVGGRRRRLDFAYPALLIAIELDGWAEHLRIEKFRDDRVRANDLTLLGWTVVRFTWHDVIHRPGYVASTLRRLLVDRNRRTG